MLTKISHILDSIFQ